MHLLQSKNIDIGKIYVATYIYHCNLLENH